MTKLRIIRIIVITAGIFSLTLGALQGGYRDTLMKAIRICLECIGIG